MPQNGIPTLGGKKPAGSVTPLNTDASGNLGTALSSTSTPTQPRLDAQSNLRATIIPANSALGLTAPTIVKASPGRVGAANILVGGSAAGGIYDCLTTAAASATNQIAMLPILTTAQLSSLSINTIAKVGIVVLPGTGQTVSVGFE